MGPEDLIVPIASLAGKIIDAFASSSEDEMRIRESIRAAKLEAWKLRQKLKRKGVKP